MLRSLRSRGGQIVIPAMLMFPTLFLFVYLIYETAKLSREKIRHQFAMDAAAFVEMTNYSDFLNRTAYVNGAFPMRIFEEGYHDFPAECEGKTAACNGEDGHQTAEQAADGKIMYAKILFQNGAFPHVGGTYQNNHPPESSLPGGKWDIEYGGRYAKKNSNPPDLSPEPSNDGTTAYELFSLDDADHYWHPYDLATEIYRLYLQVYGLLGSVESAQFQVLKRLSKGSTADGSHSFLRKSYWLNTGDPVGDAAVLANSFDRALGDFESQVHPNCLKKLQYWGNKHKPSGLQPYVPEHTDPLDLTTIGSGVGCQSTDGNPTGGAGGLFQIESVDDPMISKLRAGLPIQMPWAIPNTNFFQVPFKDLMESGPFAGAELRTTISLKGDPNSSPSVWPDPTPKFQVRQSP